MGVSLDLRKAHLTRQHGDLVAVYTWMNDERALIMIPAFRAGAPWYIVFESAAFRSDDPSYLAKQCIKACEVLGSGALEPNVACLSYGTTATIKTIGTSTCRSSTTSSCGYCAFNR